MIAGGGRVPNSKSLQCQTSNLLKSGKCMKVSNQINDQHLDQHFDLFGPFQMQKFPAFCIGFFRSRENDYFRKNNHKQVLQQVLQQVFRCYISSSWSNAHMSTTCWLHRVLVDDLHIAFYTFAQRPDDNPSATWWRIKGPSRELTSLEVEVTMGQAWSNH